MDLERTKRNSNRVYIGIGEHTCTLLLSLPEILTECQKNVVHSMCKDVRTELMCIVAFAWHVLDDMPLCLISNRDEFYYRPSAVLHQWEASSIIAGQDLQSGGT